MPSVLSIIGQPFIPGWAELRPFVAEAWLIGTMIAVLLAPFFTRRVNLVSPIIALAGLALGLLSMVLVGNGDAIIGEHFRGLLFIDGAAIVWKVLLFIFTGGVVLMWYATIADQMREGDAAEFLLLLLGATLGMSLMASSGNLLMIFMAVELASLPSYVLAGFRKTNKLGAEASLKYVLFGAACSSMMAYALSLLYGLYGTLQISDIATAMAAGGTVPALAAVALLGVLVGIGFKIAAVPFHFWCPDVFQGAHVDVSLFLSAASKGAGLLLLLRVAHTFGDAYGYSPASSMLTTMAVVLSVLGIVTMTAGNTAALVQTNVKRLLAYSSIAHAGYMICAVALLTKSSTAAATYNPAALSTQSLLAYLAVYFLMNLGAFTVAGVVYRQTGSESIPDYAGLGRRSPLLAVCMAVFMVSLIGIPPLAGFWAKVNIMTALIGNGGWWWTSAAAIGINTIVSMYFYLRVVKVMYLDESPLPKLRFAPLGTAIAGVCAGLLFVLFIGWGLVISGAERFGDLQTAKPQATVLVTR
ncbi:MAG TPA: NADH-quinone oxidoreductase subunit N [Tepidisphaeraceae bacterium]|jgi:NADH-quinone oxidoreductase subunit N|nr:NADH-quinone oxidoreductase subunit N [Tepidisphaeraceae bacterium]